MRRREREITDSEVIEEILRKSEVCRIAMIDQDIPYIVPLNYGYKGNALYIHSAPEGRKMEILKLNNHVCFEIEYSSEIIREGKACDWGTRYRSLIGYGFAEIITDTEQKEEGLDIIMSHNGKLDTASYSNSLVESLVIIKIVIDSISGKQSGDWN